RLPSIGRHRFCSRSRGRAVLPVGLGRHGHRAAMNPLGDLVTTTQRATTVCDGSSFFCKFNYDTLISSTVAMVLTLLLGFWIARSLRSRRPGKLQMILEFLLGYIKELVRDNVGAEAADGLTPVALPIAATAAIFILIAN